MTTIYSKAGADAAIGAALDALTPEDVGADPAGTATAAIAALDLGTAAMADATDFAPASSAAYPVQQVTLAGNLAYTLPVDAPADQVIPVVFTQDASGGHTVTYDGQPVTVDTAAGAETLVEVWPGGGIAYPGATAAGRALLDAPDAAAQRVLIQAAPVSRVNIGNRIAVIGSSTTKGGDNEPGIAGGAIRIAGDSWYTWAQLFSEGAIQRTINAGIFGNELAQMDARVEADVCAFTNPSPTACIIYSGYNDAYQWAPSNIYAKTPAQFIASLDSICAKLIAAGIVPIIATPFPTLGDIAKRMHTYAIHEREYAATRGLILLDFWTWTIDPATGGLRAEFGSTDNTHPAPAGYKIIGQKVWDALKPYLPPPSFRPTQFTPADGTNIVPNGLFTGTVTSGRAASVGVVGSLPAGVTASVVADPTIGNMQTLTLTGAATGEAKLFQRINDTGGAWAPGDVLEVSGVISATVGLNADVRVQYNQAPYGTAPILLAGTGADKNLFSTRVRVPSEMTNPYFDVQMSAGSALVAQSGTAAWGQLTVRNLTKLGLAT